MRRIPPAPAPTLAQRAFELANLRIPDAQITLDGGHRLRYFFGVAPGPFSRVYRCLLEIACAGSPKTFVLQPDLSTLAAGRRLPHVYPHNGPGTKLCLWLPRRGEWVPQMRMLDTYLVWTAEWLNYFEEWLLTDVWAGGGEHPQPRRKRWRAPA